MKQSFVVTGLFSFIFLAAAVVFADPAFAQVTTANSGNIALGSNSPMQIIGLIINIALGFLAFLAVSILIYGGFLWMTAAGNEEKIAQAKRLLRDAAIGLLIILSSWGITLWILGAFLSATGGNAGGGNSACNGCSIPTGGGGSSFYVVSTNPSEEQHNVLLCTDITVRMSAPINKDTVKGDVFQLAVSGGAQNGAKCSTNNACASGQCTNNACEGDTVTGTIGFGPGENTNYFNFVPSKSMEQNTTYQVTIKGGADGIWSLDTDLANGIDDSAQMSGTKDFVFYTGADTDTTPPYVLSKETEPVSKNSPFPGKDAGDICLNTVINYDFSEPMRITSFNDQQSFVLAKATGITADWAAPIALKGWSFGSTLEYGQARPATQLEANSAYGTRLYGGDAANNFAGAVQDSCGNALDGNNNGTSQGDSVDNYVGHEDGAPENATVWTTGETAECTPIIDNVTPGADYYGEYKAGVAGAACTQASDCASNACSAAGKCVGNGDVSRLITISGKYLGPHAEVQFQDENRTLFAAEAVNSCFNTNHTGNIESDLSQGDWCLDEPVQTISELKLQAPVGSGSSHPRVSVAGIVSAETNQTVGILSPNIAAVDPSNGSAGQYITFHGDNFGDKVGKVLMKSADGSRTAEMALPDANLCGSTWSSTQIIAVVPKSYTNADGTTGDWVDGDIAYMQIVRAVDGADKFSDLQQFTFNGIVRPNLCRITPQCSDGTATSVTIVGDRLGGSQDGKRVVMTSLADVSTGYDVNISNWGNQQIEGKTKTDMGQANYWTSVFDPSQNVNSNGLAFDVPCTPAPKVAEINQCDASNNIFPSPNPRPNDTNACINSSLGILFDQSMDTGSFNFSNISIQQFNKGASFDSSYKSFQMSDVSSANFYGTVSNRDWRVTVGDNEYYGFQLDVRKTPTDSNQDGTPDGSSDHLQPNTWYQVTLTPNLKNNEGIGLAQPYVYHFKTKNSTDLCVLDSVDVSPASSTVNHHPASETLTASPRDAECHLLPSKDYSWLWSTNNEAVGQLGTSSSNHPAVINVHTAGATAANQGTATIGVKASDKQDTAAFNVDFAFCTSDADCVNAQCGSGISTCNPGTQRCTPVIKNFTPDNGDNGTWATINGCYLGVGQGSVKMEKSGVSALAEFPNPAQCGSTWTDNQVIVEVPEKYASAEGGGLDTQLDSGEYLFTLRTSYNLSTTTGNQFAVNDTARPGICKIDPNKGSQLQSVTVVGHGLGADTGKGSFLTASDVNGDKSLDRLESIVNTWSTDEIKAQVAVGTTSPSVKDGGGDFRATLPGGSIDCKDGSDKCTNPLAFTASCVNDVDCGTGICTDAGVCATDPDPTCNTTADCVQACGYPGAQTRCENNRCTPAITELSPSTSAYGSAITVNGCFFGPQTSTSAVKFNDVTAQYACASSWADKSITVLVPNADQIPASTNVSVLTGSGATSNDAAFNATNQCSADQTPVLCSVNPTTVKASTTGTSSGTRVMNNGKNFTDNSIPEFTRVNTLSAPTTNGLSGTAGGASTVDGRDVQRAGATSVSSVVPYEAVSGDTSVKNGQCVSNSKTIAVSCSTAAQCPVGAACVNGTCQNPDVLTCSQCTGGTSAAVCGEATSAGPAVLGCSNTVSGAGDNYGCCTKKPTIISSSVTNNQTGVCPNSRITVDFSEDVDYSTVELQEVNGTDTPQVAATLGFNPVTHRLSFAAPVGTASLLQPNKEYQIYIPTSVHSVSTLLALLEGETKIHFTTTAQNCVPDSVIISDEKTGTPVTSHTFTAAGDQTTVEARVFYNNTEIIPTPNVNWDYVWAPYFQANQCDNIIWIDGDQSQSAISSSQVVKAGTENNKSSAVSVSLTPTAGWSNRGINDSAAMNTFFCNPAHLWEYEDAPYSNGTLPLQKSFVRRGDGGESNPQYFKFVYCAEGGLPALNAPIVNVGGNNDAWFLQYLFINPTQAQEAFAVRVFANSQNLSPAEWYEKNVPIPGANPTRTTVDGYEAIQDGSSYYVSASNIDSSAKDADGKSVLYGNIYLITFNDKDDTALKGEILKNMVFNTNVSTAAASGANVNACYASSDKAKLVRDTKRIDDLTTVANKAGAVFRSTKKYPDPKSQSFGSYISNITTSTWNSWQGALGNVLGSTLPTDPFNFYYAGAAYDPYNADPNKTPWVSKASVADCKYDANHSKYYDQTGTCWDPVNNTFFCPANSSVYLYKKVNDTTAQLYAHLEYKSTTTQTFEKRSNVKTSDNICDGSSNNSMCSCFNYGITSQASPGAPWQPIN